MASDTPPPTHYTPGEYLIKHKLLLHVEREVCSQETGPLVVSKQTDAQVNVLPAQEIHTWRLHL